MVTHLLHAADAPPQRQPNGIAHRIIPSLNTHELFNFRFGPFGYHDEQKYSNNPLSDKGRAPALGPLLKSSTPH
ncbi:hypothetical protein EVAR_53664_1 [Eumeta japonica]|uniref:Uncharacterized protein n=1 Tax=Eumeta variegata TaxID=151549 RepID=A0A4C2A2G8_EUMVA|nr:hypothetical protein EVAR_53664_1 [Eumeta japonica]